VDLTTAEILVGLTDTEVLQRRTIRLSAVRPGQRVWDERTAILDHGVALRHLQFPVYLSGQKYEIDQVLNAVEQGVALPLGQIDDGFQVDRLDRKSVV